MTDRLGEEVSEIGEREEMRLMDLAEKEIEEDLLKN